MDTAQAELRERQGHGARYDASDAPHEDLLLARRNTALFARILNGVADSDLSARRRRIVAQVGYEARAMAQALERGQDVTFEDFDVPSAVEKGVTLPPRALRSLFKHSEVHLNVTWRDLGNPDWALNIVIAGQSMAVRDLPRLRADSLRNAARNLSARS